MYIIANTTRLELLQDRIKSLYNSLLSTAEYEKSLGKRTKQLFQDVATQRMERDKTVSKQFAQNAEIGELKRELLKAQNEVNLATERETKIKKELDENLKQKSDLIKDIEEIRRHKADMLEPALLASTKELKVRLLY